MLAHPVLARQKIPVLLLLNKYETEDDDDGDLYVVCTCHVVLVTLLGDLYHIHFDIGVPSLPMNWLKCNS